MATMAVPPPSPPSACAHARARRMAPPTGSSPPVEPPGCLPHAGWTQVRRRPAGAPHRGARAQSTRRPTATCRGCGRPAGGPRPRSRRCAPLPQRAPWAPPPRGAPARQDGGPARRRGSPTASCRCRGRVGPHRGGRRRAARPRRARVPEGAGEGQRTVRPPQTTQPLAPSGGMKGGWWRRGETWERRWRSPAAARPWT